MLVLNAERSEEISGNLLLDQLLGAEEGRGFAQLMEQLPRERLIIAVGGVATLQRAIDGRVVTPLARALARNPALRDSMALD